MAKKKIKHEQEHMENEMEQNEVIDFEQVIPPETNNKIPLTHQALSIIKNDTGSYSVVQIKFNPKEDVVSSKIEVIETNTDLFIVQERLSVLLFDVHNQIME